MSMETLLMVVLIVLLAGTLPVWSHSKSWGYAPSGVFTLVLIIFLIWALGGGRPLFGSGHSVRDGVHDAGQDIKSAGRDVASSIRRTVE